MIAHIIHKHDGSIVSIVIQETETTGELEIRSNTDGEIVTAVDLHKVFPNNRHPTAQDIISKYRVDMKQKTLKELG